MAPLMIFMSLVLAHEERLKVSTCPNPNKLMVLACNDWAIPTSRGCSTVGSMNITKAIRRRGGAAPPSNPAKGGTPPFNTPPVTRLWGEARAKTGTFLREKFETPV